MLLTSLTLYTSHVGHVLQIAPHSLRSPVRSLGTAQNSASNRLQAPLRFPSAPEERPTLLVCWHLLSLDAPTVAVLWTAFIAHSNGLQLPAASLTAMFVAVWLLYAGDRLLDTRPTAASAQQLEARHRFHARHRRAFIIGIAVAVPLLAFFLPQLPPAAIRLYLVEGSFLVGYFLLLHVARATPRLPKEFAVGLFFAAATFIPTIARDSSLRPSMILPALLLAVLCSLNCLFIYRWEHSEIAIHAHWITASALRLLRPLAMMLLAAALLCAWLMNPAARTIAGAVAASTTLLLALDACRDRLPATTLRATADLALLTPALFLVFP